jgi:signal transduction histidine kinase
MLNTLNRRLIFSHLLVVLVSVSLIYAFSSRTIYQAEQDETEHRMEDLAFAASNALEGSLENYFEGEASLVSLQRVIAIWFADEPDLSYAIFLPDGTPVINNEAIVDPPGISIAPEVFLALENLSGEADIIRPNESGIEMIYVALRIEREEEIYGILRLGTPLQIAIIESQKSLNALLIFTLLIVIGVGLAGSLLARNLAKPIAQLTQTAQKLAQGDLSARIKPTGPGEIRRLTETFNSMATSLQENTHRLQDFVANASHELRTPLTIIKLRVEALRAGANDDHQVAPRFLSEIESEIDRLSSMVSDLLDLSRIEAGLESDSMSWLHLEKLAEETRQIFQIRARKKHILVQIVAAENTPLIFGNQVQLRRVFDNLVANALESTGKDGQITVNIYLSKDLGWVHVDIIDTGTGIAKAHLPHIFERFYRIDKTRPRGKNLGGAGLGLAITKAIVHQHGGEITAHSELGDGTTFKIKLPSAA